MTKAIKSREDDWSGWTASRPSADRGPFNRAALRSTVLIEVSYACTFLKMAPIRLIGQVVNSSNGSYIWVDGLDRQDPIMMPVANAPGSRRMFTMETFGRENEDLLHQIAACAMSRKLDLSPLLMVRSVEALRFDQAGPDRAIDVAIKWSRVLLELDELERQAFNRTFAEAAEALREAELDDSREFDPIGS